MICLFYALLEVPVLMSTAVVLKFAPVDFGTDDDSFEFCMFLSAKKYNVQADK